MALQKACDKFERRFRKIETMISDKGQTLETATLEDMEDCWQQIKQQERQ